MKKEAADKPFGGRGGSKPGEHRGGRKPGVPNKVTTEFRETVRRLLEDNSENVAVWLDRVANGVPSVDSDGLPVHGKWDVEPDPDKALQRLCGLAEYAAPKLSRTELTGAGGKDLAAPQFIITPVVPKPE